MATMSTKMEEKNYKNIMKNALVEIQKLKYQVNERNKKDNEPIAIIGMSCRFPGAKSINEFWNNIVEGKCSINDVPDERWSKRKYYSKNPEEKGKSYIHKGGFIENVKEFDMDFFGVTPRESVSIDPQHRLLLELTYEAIENAAIDLNYTDRKVGVFIGISTGDYSNLIMRKTDYVDIDAHMAIGNGSFGCAGRISHTLGLKGPSLVIDTACSSSLVNIHYAALSLRKNECSMAICGAANLMLAPDANIALSQAKMLSPDGLCKTFDKDANGYARGEGAGVVVLKRLSDAIASNDKILAVVAGSAVNHNGTGNGITVPNGLSQEALIQAAIESADISFDEIDYVEAHGTGTSLGDPIEIGALKRIVAKTNRNKPLYVGSVKTNIGHIEAAAGMAGIIKTVLAMQHSIIPKHINLKNLNPLLELNSESVRIPTENCDWLETSNKPKYAGISAFGLTGTNSHLILKSYNQPEKNIHKESIAEKILPISAKSKKTLMTLTKRYIDLIHTIGEEDFLNICYSAGVGRTHYKYRLCIIAQSKKDAEEKLQMEFNNIEDNYKNEKKRIIFVFNDYTNIKWNKFSSLYQSNIVFRKWIEKGEEIFKGFYGESIKRIILNKQIAYNNNVNISNVQKIGAYFTIECALAQTLKYWGVEPNVLLGFGIGEFTSACISGIINFHDGMKLCTAYSELVNKISVRGLEATIHTSEDTLLEVIKGTKKVGVREINGRDVCIINGKKETINFIIKKLTQNKIKCEKIQEGNWIDLEAGQDDINKYCEITNSIQYCNPFIDVVSGSTGVVNSKEMVNSKYWNQLIQRPEKIRNTIDSLLLSNNDIYFEVSGDATYSQKTADILSEKCRIIYPTIGTQREKSAYIERLIAYSYIAGAEINWKNYYKNRESKKVLLPNYPMDRKMHWIEPRLELTKKYSTGELCVYPLLGIMEDFADGSVITFSHEVDHVNDDELFIEKNENQIGFSEAFFLEILFEIISFQNERGKRMLIKDFEIGCNTFNRDKTSEGLRVEINENDPSDDVLTLSIKDDEGQKIRIGEALVSECLNSRNVKRADPSILELLRSDEILTNNIGSNELKKDNKSCIEKIFKNESSILLKLNKYLVKKDKNTGYILSPKTLSECFSTLRSIQGIEFNQSHWLRCIDGIELYNSDNEWSWLLAEFTKIDEDERNNCLKISLIDNMLLVFAEVKKMKYYIKKGVGELGEQNDYISEVIWRHTPKRKNNLNRFPDKKKIEKNTLPFVMECIKEINIQDYKKALYALDKMAIAYFIEYLLRIAKHTGMSSDSISIDTVKRNINKKYYKLIDRIIQILTDDNKMQQIETDFYRIELNENYSVKDTKRKYCNELTIVSEEAKIVERCGKKLFEVTSGVVDPLNLLFPKDETSVEYLYREAAGALVIGDAIKHYFIEVINTLGNNEKIRILEIGAGTGSTTKDIIGQFIPSQNQYWFTDISDYFLINAKKQFEKMPFIEYAKLDIENDPIVQGFSEEQFDIIIAANVLHATKNINETLENTRKLLKENGKLVIVEGTSSQRWTDIIFGLTEGWWRFEDERLKKGHPMMSISEWRKALNQNGFSDEFGYFSDIAKSEIGEKQDLIIATKNVSSTTVSNNSKVWIVFSNNTYGNFIRKELELQNRTCILVGSSDSHNIKTSVNPLSEESFITLFSKIPPLKNKTDIEGIIYAFGQPEEKEIKNINIPFHSEILTCGLLNLSKVIRKNKLTEGRKIWILTENVHYRNINRGEGGIVQAPLWGAGKVIAQEMAEYWGGMIDIVGDNNEKIIKQVINDVLEPDNEDQIIYRNKKRLAARLVGSKLVPNRNVRFKEDASYLITGGFGFLGSTVAEWLAKAGARNIILTSRSGNKNANAKDVINKLTNMGVTVETYKMDLSKNKSVQNIIKKIGKRIKNPLRGVIHSAGVPGFAPLEKMENTYVSEQFDAKVKGVWSMYKCIKELSLDFFIGFSSAASVWGGQGQAHYAAANYFIDRICDDLLNDKTKMISVNWGQFETDKGMVTDDLRDWLRKIGVMSLKTDNAMTIMGSLIMSKLRQAVVANVDWTVFKEVYNSRGKRTLLDEIGGKGLMISKAASENDDEVISKLEKASDYERLQIIISYVSKEVGLLLGYNDDEEIDIERGFFEMGMDSLVSIEFKNRLESITGKKIPSSIAFDYPNISELSKYLLYDVLGFEKNDSEDKHEIEENEFDTGDISKNLSETDIDKRIDEELSTIKNLL